MKSTQTCRSQHDEIRRAVQELASVVADGDATAIRTALARLSALLDVHLAHEDSSFYPALFKHADTEVRRIAKVYQDSMRRLIDAYAEFRARWMQPGEIESDPDGFGNDLAKVVGALDKRIVLEDTTLYLMVDRLANGAV
jgi:DUF438 domain-containing protein